MDIRGSDRATVYYGWWVLLAGAITEMLAIGSTSYAAGLFVLPLQQELSLSRAEANSSIPLLFSGGALLAPFVGSLFDRYRVEHVMRVGGLLLGAGFLIIAFTSYPLVMAFALLIPMAFGFMAIGPISTTTLASRWFYRRRGRALGIATVATSAGGILVVPLLSWSIQSFGWRTALVGEGVIIPIVVILLTTFVVRGRPEEHELLSSAESPGKLMRVSGLERSPERWRMRRILITWNFWMIALMLAAITGVSQALVVTAVPYGTGLGFSQAPLALLISAFAVAAAIVKVASGFLAEFVDLRVNLFASGICMTLSLCVLLASSSYEALFLACCLAGTALGFVLPSTAALVAEYFGLASFGTVMGALYVAIGLASILSVPFVGGVYDRTGSYRDAFLTFLVPSVAATLAAIATRRRPTLHRTD